MSVIAAPASSFGASFKILSVAKVLLLNDAAPAVARFGKIATLPAPLMKNTFSFPAAEQRRCLWERGHSRIFQQESPDFAPRVRRTTGESKRPFQPPKPHPSCR
ncbi:MAG: hypothetical protein ABSD08_12805 [Xanthobacteraceae bacterium]|jgi:hypothetical protein